MATYITQLRQKAKAGDRGFPRATLAYYGPDDRRATKAVLGIFLDPNDEGTLHKFYDETRDVRYKRELQADILARLREHEVRTLIMVEKVFGCPHEEGIDYPEGEACPKCPFWKDRDRYSALD